MAPKRCHDAGTTVVASVGTLAGAQRGFAHDPAGDARFDSPGDVAIDGEGNVIVADSYNHCIRKVAPDGTVSTLAGSREGQAGFADGPAGDARFDSPDGVAIDGEGNVIVADNANHCIRKLTSCGLSRGLAVPRFYVGPASMTRGLLSMLEDDEFADTTFEVEGARITAHRALLVTRSDFFRGMLKSSCREAQPGAIIQIGETTAAAFRKVLAFLYTDTLELDDDVVIDVMCKAREYDLTRAYNICMRYCIRGAQSSNAVSWLLKADEAQLGELRAEMLRYIQRHFCTIRAEAPGMLAGLRANPDLMFEVMSVLNVV